jgi:hypothetical protein
MFNVNGEQLRGGTICLSSAGLAEGTNSGTIKIVAPNGAGVDFAINGLLYHKADTDNIAITAATAQADLTTCLYLVTLNASGTLATVKGTEVLTANLTAGTHVLDWPAPAANTCPIGAIKVVNSGGTFTAGTTDLGAATVTDTYYNIFAIPEAPLTS